MARQALADPDWFVKVRLGRGDEVRRCTYTNYCEALDQAHRAVTCKLWDRVDLDEPGIATVDDGRRRLEPPTVDPRLILRYPCNRPIRNCLINAGSRRFRSS